MQLTHELLNVAWLIFELFLTAIWLESGKSFSYSKRAHITFKKFTSRPCTLNGLSLCSHIEIVDCALHAASILEFISLLVVSKFIGFISLYSSLVVEIRGLFDVISCLGVLYAHIFLYCIYFFVLAVCLVLMVLFSCSRNTFSSHGKVRIYKSKIW